MIDRIPKIAGRLAASVLGLVWGFFVAFNVVFSDIFGATDMAAAVAFVLGAYSVLGLAVGAVGPATGWRWAPWLAVPGLLFVMLSLADNVARIVYVRAVIAAITIGSVAGAWAGARLRRHLTRDRGAEKGSQAG